MMNVQNKRSAVLVLILKQDQKVSIVLTRRHASLKHHASQISFPGGKVELGETSADAATREFAEEVGKLHSLTMLGTLPMQITSTDYEVTPMVAYSAELLTVCNCTAEVDEVIFIPFKRVIDIKNYVLNQDPKYKIIRHHYCFSYHSYFIWGVTATILKTLAENNELINRIQKHIEESL